MMVAGERIFDGQRFIRGTLAIQGGRIAAIKSAREGYALITPGLIDSHLHLVNLGLDLQGLQLNRCQSQGEFIADLRKHLQAGGEGWITGRGWDQNKLGFTPHRQLLDFLCPHRPMILTRACGHVAAVNSKALEAAGITKATVVAGGVLQRDFSGELTGILEEKAVNLVTDVIPQPDAATLYSALVAAIKYAYSCGITGAHTDDRGQVKDYLSLWDLYHRVTQSYPLRVQLHYTIGSPEDLRDYLRLGSEHKDTDFVFKGAAKLFLDGSLGARTAALMEDYSDDPGNKGVLVYDDSTVREIVTIAEESGIQLAVHAIGDRAAEQFLRILREVRGAKPGRVRHRIVHFQVTNIDQINRAKALDLAIDIQPGFLPTDMQWAESRLGRKRLQTSYCWRTMDKAGLYLSGGSDAPVEDINPWRGVAVAVTRQDGRGNFAAAWQKDESLTLTRSLSLFTAAAAGVAGWQQLGTIGPGNLADLGLYSQFDPDNLWETRPDQVLIQGNTVYQR